jgi:nitrite reductase/ring-hydroxylating ferredoxin subunit
MSKYVEAIKTIEIAPGGMKAVEIEGHEIVICNANGKFYAIKRRCGHMNAPLDLGTLDGTILTCAMHCAQFDITTGESLSGPILTDLSKEKVSPRVGKYFQDIGMIMKDVRTHDIQTYLIRLEAGSVLVKL